MVILPLLRCAHLRNHNHIARASPGFGWGEHQTKFHTLAQLKFIGDP